MALFMYFVGCSYPVSSTNWVLLNVQIIVNVFPSCLQNCWILIYWGVVLSSAVVAADTVGGVIYVPCGSVEMV